MTDGTAGYFRARRSTISPKELVGERGLLVSSAAFAALLVLTWLLLQPVLTLANETSANRVSFMWRKHQAR
jgi:hypothetical protein